MDTIQRVIDGDTLKTDTQEDVRLGYIDTPESKHPNEDLNVPEGDTATELAESVLPRGTEVQKHDYGMDHFGRTVSGVERVIGDKTIDYGLVALDQQMSTYYTRFGEHPDPLKHDQYKEYYGELPYQLGATEELLDSDDMLRMQGLQDTFTDVYSGFKNGTNTQEEFDTATANLYGNPLDVMKYRRTLSAQYTEKNQDNTNTLTGAMKLAIEAQPELAEQYNRAVRNGGLQFEQSPEDKASFWSNTKTSIEMFNSVANLTDIDELYTARKFGATTEFPDSEIVKGVPEQYHSMLLQEAAKYSDYAAIVKRDQLIEDIANNKQFDDMSLLAQFGYGAGAMIFDPTTYVAGAAGIKALGAASKLWQAVGGKSASKLASWAAGGTVAGATESVLTNAPRLAADHTYTARDFMLDTVADTTLGLGLGAAGRGLVQGAKKVPVIKNYVEQAAKSRSLEKDQLTDVAVKEGQPEVAATPELQVVKDQVALTENAPAARAKVAEVTKTTYDEWSAINKVSEQGFVDASNTLAETFPANSPMRMLINSQKGLNKKNLSPEQLDEVVRLNSDILHIAAAFPDGNVPKAIDTAINGVTFKQRTKTQVNALDSLLTGKSTEPRKTLSNYIQALRNQEHLWEGYDVQPMTRGDFFAHQSDWLSMEGVTSADDVFNLTSELPKELSYLKDVIELNKLAAKQNDAAFTELVEELNGLATVRAEQVEYGNKPDYADSTKSWGATVAMSPEEISAQLKKEGLQPRTDSYSKRLKELRQRGRVAVSKEVQEVGNQPDYEVGKLNKESVFDADKAQDFGEQIQTTLVKDDLEQDLLPRSYTKTDSVSAYKDVSTENLKNLRKQLRSRVGNKLGVFEIKGKKEIASNLERLDKVKTVLKSDRDTVIRRMVKAGEWQNVEDVIRASHALARERKLRQQVDAPSTAALTEEDLDVLNPATLSEQVLATPQKVVEVEDQLNDAYGMLVERSGAKVLVGLTNFTKSGEKDAFKAAKKPVGVLDIAGRAAAAITTDVADKLQNSEIDSLEFFGSRVTELGKGYGGNIRRKATGGIIRDTAYRESALQILPNYARYIDDYAGAQGKGTVGKLNAQQAAGADSKLVDQFNRDVFKVQEYRRSGREGELTVHKSVTDFVGDWDKYMDSNMGQLVDNGIGGFTKDRVVKHYVPHVWVKGNLDAAIKQHGEAKVLEVFRRAYQSAQQRKINPIEGDPLELAQRQIDWIKGTENDPMLDQFLPVADSRAKHRRDLDTTTEYDGLSILDLLDTEVAGLATKYSNRMAGWVGLSKSTDGMLTSQLDIDTLKKTIIQEGKDKGIDTSKYEQYYDDVVDMMFGRPTRGGLITELRQLKDLTALTKMGGLGTAQAIETGQVITRSVLNLFSNPKVAGKIIAENATASKNDDTLIREIQSISHLTDDIEWLDRQSVHLDQAELSDVKKARQVSLWLADKATFGSLKAPASRLLGKTTGYNAIRRAQSRVTQASFTVDIARHFKYGKGVMGNKRMADLGLTEVDGTDVDLQHVFNNLVEFDESGYPTKLNIDQWPKAAQEKFQYGVVRDEAQQIQRTMIGELPPWMNRPMMQLIFQFRQMPIVANNKQLARNMAFADKEAVTATVLNTAIAGLVRYSKFAGLGAGYYAITGEEQPDPTSEVMQVDKYIANAGIFPDAVDLVKDVYKVGQSGEAYDASQVMGQLPVMGLMADYKNMAGAIAEGDRTAMMDSAFGLLPLGNTAYGDMAHSWAQETFGE